MWPRIAEFLLASWLAASPFIFRYEANEYGLPVNDWVCAMLIMVFALLSFWEQLKRIHLANIPIGLWLIGVAFHQGGAVLPYQGYVMVGGLLLVLAIVPSQALQPPQAWTAYLEGAET